MKTTLSAHSFSLPKFFLIGLALLIAMGDCLDAQAEAPEERTNRPNIVIILADDMGYGDPRPFHAESDLETPHLDTLASQGMVFTDAHSPSAVCTPTRYGLLTGRYCWRSRLKDSVLWGASPPLIETDRTTISSMLDQLGYQTGVVGKWHLGLGYGLLEGAEPSDSRVPPVGIDYTQPLSVGPNDYGFDYSMIIPASLDMAPYIFIENNQITEQPTIDEPRGRPPASHRAGPRAANLDFERTLDDLLESATTFIKESAEEEDPFFLYFPLTAPHKPVIPNETFQGTTPYGAYGDFIAQVDWTIGQVMEALDESGAAENTLLIVTSDNGSFMKVIRPREEQSEAAIHHANSSLRGGKADIWEGGHRVPFFVRWPGHVEPQSSCDATVCLVDLLSTVADVVDADLEEGAGPDSFSILPHLLQEEGEAEPRAPVIHHSVRGMFAIRSGDWKLVLGNGSGGRQNPVGRSFEEPYHLYNLREDRAESNNLIEEHPEIAERLIEEFEAIRDAE